MKKRILALLMALVLAVLTFSLYGCGGKTQGDADVTKVSESDMEYIKNKGKMTVGITIYEPMNYYSDDGTLVGFETEFAQAVCEKLGVEADFIEIDWNTKEIELNAKTIDVIWNGLTVTEERRENMDFSKSYVFNKQCLVVKAENAANYKTIDDFAGKAVVAEAGSAGEDAVNAEPALCANYNGVSVQSNTLLEVKSGTADVAVLDYVMARASVGEGTSYSDLTIVDGIDLAYEEYAVGCRKGTDTAAAIDVVIDELLADGTIQAIAEKYDMAASLITR